MVCEHACVRLAPTRTPEALAGVGPRTAPAAPHPRLGGGQGHPGRRGWGGVPPPTLCSALGSRTGPCTCVREAQEFNVLQEYNCIFIARYVVR